MKINSNNTSHKDIVYERPVYNKYLNSLIDKIIECAPLLVALAIIATLNTLMSEVAGHPIIEPSTAMTSTATFDQVDIVALAPPKKVCHPIPTQISSSGQICVEKATSDSWCTIL